MKFSTIIVIVVSLAITTRVLAEPSENSKLKVGISSIVPFVIAEGENAPKGFSIDLWNEVDEKHQLQAEFVMCDGVEDKLKRLEGGEIDVAIGGISVTRDREKRVDFTYCFLHTGLGIMTRGRKRGITIWQSLALLFTRGKIMIVLTFGLLVVISGHLMWFAERGKKMFSDRYLPGVFEGMYWAVVTASTVGYGDKAPVKWPGRLLACFVIVISLPMFAWFTAELASAFTLSRFAGEVDGPHDLTNHPIGVVKGSTADEEVRKYNPKPRVYQDLEKAVNALQTGTINAVVYDAPVLRYYAANHEGFFVLPQVFAPQDIAFAVQSGSPLREELNLILLELQRSGKIRQLRSRWFGTN